jgi:hypothetical protein
MTENDRKVSHGSQTKLPMVRQSFRFSMLLLLTPLSLTYISLSSLYVLEPTLTWAWQFCRNRRTVLVGRDIVPFVPKDAFTTARISSVFGKLHVLL